MIRYSVIALVSFAFVASSAPCSTTNDCPTASIDTGIIAGTTTSLPNSNTTVNKFLGIPFAAPPLRFSPPQSPEPWNFIYNATLYKPSCMQQFNYPEEVRNQTMQFFNNPPPPAGESEDCLNLNVFTPARTDRGLKPVLFWIYGGAFRFGSGSYWLYDGSNFAANHDVVVVTINYRTNIFGFPGYPDQPEEERNLGFLDQRLALDWVRRNIASLGGDPNKITIMGESAGAGSVDALISAPPHPLPFHAAIMQSGQASIIVPNNDSRKSWDELVKEAQCDSESAFDCIRNLPAAELKELIERMALTFNPVTDGGVTWADTPNKNRNESTNEKSSIARVPILIGSNADEGAVYALGQNDTEEYVSKLLGGTVPKDDLEKLLEAYPIGTAGIPNETQRIAAVHRDFSFQCPAKIVAEESAAVGIPTWRYYFNASFPNTDLFPGSGAYHTAELGPVFGTYPKQGASVYQAEVSVAMQEAWARFAKDPSDGPGWDRLSRVGVFGNGKAGKEGFAVFRTIDGEEIDFRCDLYTHLYEAASIG